MNQNKRAATLMASLIFAILLSNYSCHRGNNDLARQVELPPPHTDPDAPVLPTMPYDYANQLSDIPGYIQEYLSAAPSIDNTPAGNSISNHGATLGRVLFYDKALSVNNKISCASCHLPDKAFTDGKQFSVGFNEGHTRRNSMSLTNLRYFKAKSMFWDMRGESLEKQVLMPITDQVEMGMPTIAALEIKLRSIAYYAPLFQNAYGSTEVTSEKISNALAQFIRSIISFGSKYDQGLSNNFANFTSQELNGKRLVRTAFCTECHSDLTNEGNQTPASFLVVENSGINTGLGSNNGLDEVYTDKGIGEITGKSKDMGTFKIPTLRNIELTAPYMHDGRFATLDAVLEHYSSGVKTHANRGIQVIPPGFNFTAQERSDLIAFFKTLTDPSLGTNVKYINPFKN